MADDQRQQVYPSQIATGKDLGRGIRLGGTAWSGLRRCSSGSVLSQQLLFSSTSYGDLNPQISAFFDTRIGAKTETYSYRKIAEALTHNPRDLLFISDAVKEVRAASDAGMQAIICNLDVQAPQYEEAKTVIHSLDEVFPG